MRRFEIKIQQQILAANQMSVSARYWLCSVISNLIPIGYVAENKPKIAKPEISNCNCQLSCWSLSNNSLKVEFS